jgi:hypothetical protein
LTSRQIVVGDEDPRQFEELRRALERDFKPATTIERELVERLAGLLWRLRRIPGLEAALMQARLEEVGAHDLLSFLSPEARKLVEETVDLAWVEAVAKARLDEAILAELDDQPKDYPASRLVPPDEEKEKSARLYEASLQAGYEERLQKFREEVSKEPRPARQEQESPKRAVINLGLSLIKDSENHDTLGKLSRYETGLMNAITRTLALIHSLQKSELLSTRSIIDQAP